MIPQKTGLRGGTLMAQGVLLYFYIKNRRKSFWVCEEGLILVMCFQNHLSLIVNLRSESFLCSHNQSLNKTHY